MSKDRNECEVTEIERMAYEMERLFVEAEIKQTLPKKHPSIVKAEALYNAGYRKQSENVIELPCKVGDTVYVPWRWVGQRAVATVKVEEIKFYDSQMHYMFLIDMESDNEFFNQSFGGWKTERSIGTTVFLTREEAEQALAKMKGGAK